MSTHEVILIVLSPNINQLFRACTLMTTFIHKRCMNFTIVVGNQVEGEVEVGWREMIRNQSSSSMFYSLQTSIKLMHS